MAGPSATRFPYINRPTSNIEWEKIKKQTNDILEETEELIKIFVTSIKTAEKKQKSSFKV